MIGVAKMGIAQAMVGRGVESRIPINGMHSLVEKQNARSEIAAEQPLVAFGPVRTARDLALADLAEGVVEARRVAVMRAERS